MTAHDRIEVLEQALRHAIQECEAHNNEYQHRTARADLDAWRALVTETARARQQADLGASK